MAMHSNCASIHVFNQQRVRPAVSGLLRERARKQGKRGVLVASVQGAGTAQCSRESSRSHITLIPWQQGLQSDAGNGRYRNVSVQLSTQRPRRQARTWMRSCGSPTLIMRSFISEQLLLLHQLCAHRGVKQQSHSCLPRLTPSPVQPLLACALCASNAHAMQEGSAHSAEDATKRGNALSKTAVS